MDVETIAQRNQTKEVAVTLLDQLAKSVQGSCKDDMTIFLSSVFKAQSFTKTVPATASRSIRYFKPGPSSGQAQRRQVAIPGAGSYELCWTPVPAGGVPSAWISQLVANPCWVTVIPGLTPGTTYAFQALPSSSPLTRIGVIRSHCHEKPDALDRLVLIDAINSQREFSMTRNVAILIFDEVEVLDFCGPFEVFGVADGI